MRIVTKTALPRPGTRICVVGTSGSGKTTVAESLAEGLGLTYVCNDAIIWRANWQPAPRDEVYVVIDAATRLDGWTFDGNLGSSPEDRLALARCDTLVWLDLPRWQVWSQVIRRTFARILTRERLWHDNVESWRTLFAGDSIIWWSIKTYARRRRQYAALFDDVAHCHRVRVRLRSRGEVNAWLASLGASNLVASDVIGR